MQLVLLGSGSSAGVPVPGCGCSVCKSTHPRNSRNRTSAVIELPSGARILIDASPDLRAQALKFDISRIDAVLYTHAHADHIMGTEELRSFNFSTGRRIPCYGTKETLTKLKEFFQYIFEPSGEYEGGGLAQLDLHEISNETPFQIEGVTFIPFPLHHGRMIVTGFRIGDFGYATDCNGLSNRAVEVLSDVKNLIIDGLRYEPHRTHFTIPEAIDAAQRLRAERSFIVHTTHAVDYEVVSSKLPSGVELAFDGLTVEIIVGDYISGSNN